MEELFLLLLQFLLEIVFQVLVEFSVDRGFRSAVHAFRPQGKSKTMLAWAGVILIGLLGGFIGFVIFPKRIFPPLFGVSGASLVFTPLGTGAVMHFAGKRHPNTEQRLIFTFWGAALCAFFMAAVRLLLIQSVGVK